MKMLKDQSLTENLTVDLPLRSEIVIQGFSSTASLWDSFNTSETEATSTPIPDSNIIWQLDWLLICGLYMH